MNSFERNVLLVLLALAVFLGSARALIGCRTAVHPHLVADAVETP